MSDRPGSTPAEGSSPATGADPGRGAKAVAADFWDALYARDWDRVASFFGPDSIYLDVPTGPGAAAVGPDDIVRRLRLGLEDLAGYEHGPATVVAEGGIVVTEHTETWRWPTGETVTLPFVSVQHVDGGGTITLWKDYWDLGTLMAGAPPDWMAQLQGGDLSWITDVTGRV